MRIGRRDFLRGVIGVAGALVANGAPWARAVVRATSGLPPPAHSGLDHIVVVMMENRSTNHYLGWLPGIGGWLDEARARGLPDSPHGVFTQPRALVHPTTGTPLPREGGDECPEVPYDADTSVTFATYHMTRHCHVPDPDHGWDGSRAEFNFGRMNGFVHATPDPEAETSTGQHVAMGVFLAEDLPLTAWAASRFTTFANSFCSVMGPTYPNRYYLHAGQSNGERANRFGPPPDGWTFPTIWENLERAGVDWGYYFTDLPVIGLWTHLLRKHPGRIHHVSQFYADAAAGRLPNVCYVDPGFVAGFDDHPASDVKRGQRFLYDLFMALATGAQWPKAAMVITYDEHGGFFDNVPPPKTYDPLASANLCDDFSQLGFRVPTVILSPFARRGFVADGPPFDHASVLRMIEWRFGLGPCSANVRGTGLPSRDAYARNLAEVLDFDHPDPELPSEPPAPDVHLGGAWCGYIPTDEQVTLLRERAPEAEEQLHSLPELAPPYPTALGPRPQVAARPHRELIELADTGIFGRFDLRHLPVRDAFR